MTKQWSIQDQNQFPALIAHSGTADTADTIRVVADASGNLGVNIVSGEIIASMGTVDVVGTLLGVGSITNIGTIGSIVGMASSGTNNNIFTGTMQTLGTVGSVNGVGGTVKVDLATRIDGTNDSISITSGTINSVSLNPVPTTPILITSANGTAGGSLFGTLSAASGAGTYHNVTGLQIVMNSGTSDVYVGFGTALTGGSVLARGNFVPSAGIMRDFTFPIQSGTNSEICYEFAGAGTAFIAVNYFKSV